MEMTSKADIYRDMQEGLKPDIAERLARDKESAGELAAGVSPDEAPTVEDYQQIII